MGFIFLNSHRAKSGLLGDIKLPEPYILAAKFFDCGVIDRTATLDVGFDQIIMDPIPAVNDQDHKSFAEICEEQGRAIVDEALAKDVTIKVLWSGGIDSTVALIALINNLQEDSKIKVFLNMTSINEYPYFFRKHILNKLPFKVIKPPLASCFGGQGLIVTGEHGDQLFGSDKLLPLMVNKLAYEHYQDILPIYLMDKFGSRRKTDLLIDYLEPQIQASPVPIRTTFDLFWWFNLTLKWQQVSLRMPVFSFEKDLKELYLRFRHFFRGDDFQIWSIRNHENRAASSLETYKLVAKQYIHSFTNDDEYLASKSKEPSLKHIIIDRKTQGVTRYRASVSEDFVAIVEQFHLLNKNKKALL